MHYDPPPPLQITDLEQMQHRGEFRFGNQLRAWIEVDNGEITDCGYSGGTLMGVTPLSFGPLQVMVPAKGNPEIRQSPRKEGAAVTFVQTAGGRPGFSFLKPSARFPFLVRRPYTIWTTVHLRISIDGTSTQQLIGASPFPRHWLYDTDGRLAQKAALTRNQLWARTVFGGHTPWGGEDLDVSVAEAESDLERRLSDEIMRGGRRPHLRSLHAGEYLFRQSEESDSIALILDGKFEVRVDDKVVGHVGPGSVVGERAGLEAGRRTADVRAVTESRVAELAEQLSTDLLSELALGHHREDPG